MAWLLLKDNSLSGSQMCIVTGPRIDLAIAVIDRMKGVLGTEHSCAWVLEELVAKRLLCMCSKPTRSVACESFKLLLYPIHSNPYLNKQLKAENK
jgi:hypothetical protein